MSALVITSHPEFEAEALVEARAATALGKVRSLGAGLMRCEVADARVAADAVRASRPVFVRHQVPVSISLPAGSDIGAIIATANDVIASEPSGAGMRIGVQIRTTSESPWSRKHIWEQAGPALASRHALDTRWPEWVLSILVGDGADIGFAPVEVHLSPWAGGARHFAHDGDAMSRAEYKLIEACEVFGLVPAAPGRAVDLGAAPGGWTRHLAQRGLDVVAVDPAALDPRVLGLANVHHARVRAEQFLEQQRPSTIDWLVNDMRIDALEAARLLVAMRKLLAPAATLVTTLKLPRHGAVEAMHRGLAQLAAFRRLGFAGGLFDDSQVPDRRWLRLCDADASGPPERCGGRPAGQPGSARARYPRGSRSSRFGGRGGREYRRPRA